MLDLDLHEAAALPTLHLGAPTAVGALTIFPVWTDAPIPKAATPLLPPKGATIGELDTGPTVEELKVSNPTSTTFGLLEGTVVDGGWQHRVLVHDVLIGAGGDTHIPVRCVEHGRWGGGATQKLNRRRAPLGVRGAVRGLRQGQSADRTAPKDRADQGEIWTRVAWYEESLNASTTTGSMVDVFDQVDVPSELRRRVPKPLHGQRGVLVGVTGHPALLEVFDHPRSFAGQWDALVEGLLGSTAHLPTTPTSGRRARAFVLRLSGRPLPLVDRAGAGMLAEAVDDVVSVRSLINGDGQGLHTAALNVRHAAVLAT